MRNRNSNKIMSVYLMLGMVLLVIGFSYAFFIYNKTGLYTHTITGGKMKVIYEELSGNNILIENAYPRTDEEALTYGLEFEFTVTGYNESEKNVYYAIEMDYGDDLENKNRFLDTDIKLTLYENEEVVFENEIFNNLDNQDIYYNYFKAGTNSQTPTINNYKMRIWINDNVVISDTLSNNLNDWGNYEWDWLYESYPDKYEEVYNGDDLYLENYGISIYTSDEFSNSYANFKVNIKADLTYDAVDYLMYDANGGTFDIDRSSLLTNMVTTKKPIMENKGFLGWSSDKEATIPEYYAGDYYTGDGQMLYAVYSDTRNVMSDLTAFSDYDGTIREVYFVSSTSEDIEMGKEDADLVADLTKDNQGSVTGLLYDTTLVIASYGTTYLSTGYELFIEYGNTSIFDFTNADTSMVENMSYMFATSSNPVQEKSNKKNDYSQNDLTYDPDTYNNYMQIENQYYPLDLSMFNTGNVTDMSYMFHEFGNTNVVDLSSFDTSNVTNMSSMFSWTEFYYLDINNFDTSKVEDMSWMFYGANSLRKLDLSNFNTSQVTDMSGMFDKCFNFNSIGSGIEYDLNIENFDTSNVEDMSWMFFGIEELTEINLEHFNTSSVTNMSYMFNNLITDNLNLSNFETSQVTDMSGMFHDCDIGLLDISSFAFNFDVVDTSHIFMSINTDIFIYVSNADIQDWIINRMSKGSYSERPDVIWTTDNIIIKN